MRPGAPPAPGPGGLRLAGGASALLLLALVLPGCGRFDLGPPGHWEELASGGGPGPGFDPASVETLPPPARRFLRHAMAPGTPLPERVELAMEGTILLEPGGEPLALEARQILVPDRGFLWSARAHRGLLRIRGYDRLTRGEGEMRWKLYGLIPVMTASGPDVTRSAATRLVMEGVLVPSSLLPGRVEWEAVDDHHAIFHRTVAGEAVATTLEVDPEGRPVRAWADRWNEGRYERFEVRFEGSLEVDGIRVPHAMVAGWRLDDPDAFPFFNARLTSVTFR